MKRLRRLLADATFLQASMKVWMSAFRMPGDAYGKANTGTRRGMELFHVKAVLWNTGGAAEVPA